MCRAKGKRILKKNIKNYTVTLNKQDYLDRVYAAWIGKNIGGTMGGPFEGTHDMPEIDGYTTSAGEPLPNDDLDLQLVWLHAMEKLGPLGVNASTLGEMWNSFITAEWNEYGVAKVNMKSGLLPPLSGEYKNAWKNSNGSWIRTEIWATLMPGSPDLAARYAIEDAKVDHGSGEGTVASAFVAFMQSSAFVIHDLHKCLELALSAIPEDSRTAKSVRTAIDCYKNGTSLTDARNIIQRQNSDMADGWFEAPSNVAYAVLGMLYGNGDFKKSLIYAIKCGDDTDCTAATVGATLGILGGTSAIPNELKEYIGDSIKTIAIDKTSVGASFPKSCTDLTERVASLAPHITYMLNSPVRISNKETEIPTDILTHIEEKASIALASCNVKPNTVRYSSPLFFADVELNDGPEIKELTEKKITITFGNNVGAFDSENYSLEFRWWLPYGFDVKGPSRMILRNVVYARHDISARTAEFTVTASSIGDETKCVLEVTAIGRPTPLYIPITFIN